MVNPICRELGERRSCIRELFEYGRARAAVEGEGAVFDYSLGNPSIPAPPQVEQAIREILADTDSVQLHGYTTAVGELSARQAIADDLNARFSAGVRAQDLFLTGGASAALAAVFRALCTPGAEILALAPYFPEYRPLAEAAGARFCVVPADVPAFQIRLDAVEAMLTPNTAALIVNSPNNPAGTVYTRQTLTALAVLLEEKSRHYGHPIYLIADEPYRELVYDGTEVPFLPLLYRNTVVCYSYSKSLSLPGERIGYVYVPQAAEDSEAVYAAVAGAARLCGHVCAPSLWQKVIARCASVRPDLAAYDRNRQTLYRGLVESGYTVARPDGAFYLFVRAPEGDAAAFSARAKARGVLIVPGGDFGCAEYCRVCYCVPHEQILRSLPLFAELARR